MKAGAPVTVSTGGQVAGGFERKVARGVIERHSQGCGYGSSGRCGKGCTRTYRARVSHGGRGARRTYTRTFPNRPDAVAWAEAVREGAHPDQAAGPELVVPDVESAVRSFLYRARAGEVLTRSGSPYSAATVENYEGVLRNHALPYPSPRFGGRPLGSVAADQVTTQTRQALVDGLALHSRGVARLVDAALSAVLRDLYRQELLADLPGRVLLPPPPKGRTAYLTVIQQDALLAAAIADDQRRRESLMGPVLALLIDAGPRIKELRLLVWGPEGVDISGNPVRVCVQRADTKTDAGARTVGLTDEYGPMLRAHYLASGRPELGSLVFPGPNGQPHGRGGTIRYRLGKIADAAADALTDQLEKARADAGYPSVKREPAHIAELRSQAAGLRGLSIGPHLFRHSHASLMSQAEYPATEIAGRLGHTDGAFTQRRYVHPNQAQLAEAPDRLEAVRVRERQRVAG